MKLIEEYTKEELVNLKSEEVEKIIKLHLANQGIAIPKEPVEPEYEQIPNKDKKLFWIAGIADLFFEKREAAEETVKVLKNNFSQLRNIEIDYFNGDSNERVRAFRVERWGSQESTSNDLVVNVKDVYSIDLYMQIKTKLESNKKLREDYQEKRKQFDKASELAKETVDLVWETVRSAQREQELKDSKLAIYKEYLALSDGDKDIAWKFMKRAYSVVQEEEDYINANI